jgi:hypothetical protein
MKALTAEEDGNFLIESDGKTLWVNHPIYGAVGRFSPTGVDVHNQENNKCIGCHGEPDWDDFVAKMQKHHNIDLSRFKKELAWL